MVEVEFDVDLKVGFRLDLNNSSGRKAFPVGRIAFENVQKCQNTRYFFGNPKPFCVTRVPRVGVKGEMVTRRQVKEDLVRNDIGTRLRRVLRAEKFHFILQIKRSH